MTKINVSAYWLVALVSSNLILMTVAYPQTDALDETLEYRRYAEKPNNVKKVALDDIDQDIQTNQISESPFSWTNMLGNYLFVVFFHQEIKM